MRSQPGTAPGKQDDWMGSPDAAVAAEDDAAGGLCSRAGEGDVEALAVAGDEDGAASRLILVCLVPLGSTCCLMRNMNVSRRIETDGCPPPDAEGRRGTGGCEQGLASFNAIPWSWMRIDGGYGPTWVP